jgi:hypothetical protein
VDSALFDFAEAAMGKNTQMSWSISADVLRRQVSSVFVRCSNRDLTSAEACDVAMDFVMARVTNMLDIFTDLFATLESRIDVQMHGVEIPALLELKEFFLGLNSDAQWATDSKITRRELQHLFEKVYSGEYSAATGVCVFCDTITSKKEYYLELLHGMCLRLTEQIVEAKQSQETQHNPERTANGDD